MSLSSASTTRYGLVCSAQGLCDSCAQTAPHSPVARPLRAAAKPAYRRVVVVCALALVTLVALLLTDIGLIVGISGAVLGASIVYVIPSVIALRARSAMGQTAPLALYGLVPLGALIGVLGVVMTLR